MRRTPGWRALAVVALALAWAIAFPATVRASARVVVEGPVHDFGAVERGTRVEHVFRLTNRGDAELRLDQVKSSCGCTVGIASGRDIPPGGEGRVTVTLDTARLAGRTTKVVTVYTNDPEKPVANLAVSGQVWADLIVSPTALYLGRLRRGESARGEVLLMPGRPGAVYSITAVEQASPALRARLEPRADGPGQRLIVELSAALPLGRFNEQLTLRTTSPREPVLTVPVFGSVEGDVLVLPPQVTFGYAQLGSAPERDLVILNRGTRPLLVTDVSVPDEIVTYRLSAVQEGLEYHVALKLREDLRPGRVEGAVEIFTNHPQEGRLVVPLYAVVRGGRRRG